MRGRLTGIGVVASLLVLLSECYDPQDANLKTLLPSKGTFEAFYLKDEETGSSRAAHSHGTFYKHRNPALVNAKNAAAYGFRFDGIASGPGSGPAKINRGKRV
ncbi:unnamed protein product [Phyllotreta striolata]|uniref:Uncharacterized protein n=1 Tax=Phyllotreta striolata TaxID=444603 RepID=A0A9N9TZL7_PHYSR|nr:unnamed protein product [Phyllotreta striolata]